MAFTKPRRILTQGTYAAMPVASTVAEGTLYYATDTKQIYRSNLTTWDTWTIQFVAGSDPQWVLDLFVYAFSRIAFLEQALGINPGDLPLNMPDAFALLDPGTTEWPVF